jgi:hypothetical protein
MNDGMIRFVAQDSMGQCFLWAMRWGEAGYSCRSARLTVVEAEELYKVLARMDSKTSSTTCDALGYSDPSARQASFACEENALQFFITNRDPDLRRWAGVMFKAIHDSEPS